MGMFDYVNYNCKCPVCGAEVMGFQSKDGDCSLGRVEPTDVSYFYSACKGCGAWISFSRKNYNTYERVVQVKEGTTEVNLSPTLSEIKIKNLEADDLFFVLSTLQYCISELCVWDENYADNEYYKQALEAHKRLVKLLKKKGYKR